jgi:two-component system, response regulator, stage 0 sporulation protein F
MEESMEKLSVVVTDDMRGIRESLKLILEDEFDIREAQSGYEALEILKAGEITLVILDILMPGMDGLETLRRIKAMNAQVEVCMVTSVADTNSIKEATELGAFDYIVKPFDVTRVRATLLKMEQVVRSRSKGGKIRRDHLN